MKEQLTSAKIKNTRQHIAVKLAAVFLTLSVTGPLSAQTYQIDPTHSAVTFRVAHLVISMVSGRFGKFSGSINYDGKSAKSLESQATIEVASINTDVPDRDKHLVSGDFFDAEKYPQITFKSTKVSGVKKNEAKLHGELTIRGVTKPVILNVKIGGVGKDPWGNERFGATATTKINRKDFGVSWSKTLETGGLVVGDDVEISLEIEGIAKK